MSEVIFQCVELSEQAPGYGRGLLVVLGALLILAGWRAYRFWFAGAVTLIAGIWGTLSGPDYGVSGLLAGPLAAIAIGCIALAVTRIVLFVAGGWFCWQVASLVMGNSANLLVCVLLGGILSTVLFRLMVRLVTAGLGVVLVAIGLRWIGAGGELTVLPALSAKFSTLDVRWLWLFATLGAASLQALTDKGIDWWRARREQAKKKAEEKKEALAHAA